MRDGFEEDAAMPLAGSSFEPKTPFPYRGVIHNPAQEGTPTNHGYQSGADMIEVSNEIVMAEIALGLHDKSGRPISALLNHCLVVQSSPIVEAPLREFYATVKKRNSARRRIRVETKKKEETRIEVKEESFGVVEDGNNSKPPVEAKSPVKKKGKPGRKKGSKNKGKEALAKITEA